MGLHFQVAVTIKVTQVRSSIRNPEAKTEAESREEHCFRLAELYCSEIHPVVAQLAPYIPWDHLPRGSTTHSELGPSTSVTNQENATTSLPTGQSGEYSFLS